MDRRKFEEVLTLTLSTLELRGGGTSVALVNDLMYDSGEYTLAVELWEYDRLLAACPAQWAHGDDRLLIEAIANVIQGMRLGAHETRDVERLREVGAKRIFFGLHYLRGARTIEWIGPEPLQRV